MKDINNYDVVIAGAGFTGAIIARNLADHGYRILVVDRRDQIGGDSADIRLDDGQYITKYGVHIFHTNSDSIMEYMEKFSEFYPYRHKVVALVNDKKIPLPINLNSLDMLGFDGDSIKSLYGTPKIFLSDLLNSNDESSKEVGAYLYEHIYRRYSYKQWNLSLDELDPAIINRIPIYLDRNDEHFRDKYQVLPRYGYTSLITNIITHENVEIELGHDVREYLAEIKRLDKLLVYAGSVDELADYKYGVLPYRSVKFIPESYYSPEERQSVCGYNYSDTFDISYHRTLDYGYLQENLPEGISYKIHERALAFDPLNPDKERFYSIRTKKNIELYDKYVNYLNEEYNIYLCGGRSLYYDPEMAITVQMALEHSDKILNRMEEVSHE